MKKQLLTLVTLLSAIGFGYAQDSGSQSSGGGDFAPKAGDITASLFFGRSLYQSGGFSVPNAPYASSSWSVGGSNPAVNSLTTDNAISNMAGVEARYFVTSNIAAKITGGAIISNSPSFVNIPGVIDPNANNAAWIPAVNAVSARNNVDTYLNIGGEYHFTTKVARLSPYVGLTIPFYYGRRSEYDPTIVDVPNQFGSQGGSPNYYYAYNSATGQYDILVPLDPSTGPADGSGVPYLADVGNRHSEQYGFGVQAAAGFDYYISEGLYFGFEIKPLSYIYSATRNFPAPGLEPWQAKTTTWAFFAQPFVKFGIKF